MNIIDEIIKILDEASRVGAPIDVPEGSRYIMISDTLCKELSFKLKEWCDENKTNEKEHEETNTKA